MPWTSPGHPRFASARRLGEALSHACTRFARFQPPLGSELLTAATGTIGQELPIERAPNYPQSRTVNANPRQ